MILSSVRIGLMLGASSQPLELELCHARAPLDARLRTRHVAPMRVDALSRHRAVGLIQFDPDEPSAELEGYDSGGAAAGEGIQNGRWHALGPAGTGGRQPRVVL